MINCRFLFAPLLTLLIQTALAQSPEEPKQWEKNRAEYHKEQIKRAKKIFRSCIYNSTTPSVTVNYDSLENTYKSDVVLSFVTDTICSSLFLNGILTGEMFYNAIDLDPSKHYDEGWRTEEGDTLKNSLWNGGKGSLIIIHCEPLPEIDKGTEKNFCIWVTTQKLMTGGHMIYYLKLDTRSNYDSFQNFLDQCSVKCFQFSHSEV